MAASRTASSRTKPARSFRKKYPTRLIQVPYPLSGCLKSESSTSGSSGISSTSYGSLRTGSLRTGSIITGSLRTGSLRTGSIVTRSLRTGSLQTASLQTASLQTGTLRTGSRRTGCYRRMSQRKFRISNSVRINAPISNFSNFFAGLNPSSPAPSTLSPTSSFAATTSTHLAPPSAPSTLSSPVPPPTKRASPPKSSHALFFTNFPKMHDPISPTHGHILNSSTAPESPSSSRSTRSTDPIHNGTPIFNPGRCPVKDVTHTSYIHKCHPNGTSIHHCSRTRVPLLTSVHPQYRTPVILLPCTSLHPRNRTSAAVPRTSLHLRNRTSAALRCARPASIFSLLPLVLLSLLSSHLTSPVALDHQQSAVPIGSTVAFECSDVSTAVWIKTHADVAKNRILTTNGVNPFDAKVDLYKYGFESNGRKFKLVIKQVRNGGGKK